MSKKKKKQKGKNKAFETVVLASAIIDLIIKFIELLKELLE